MHTEAVAWGSTGSLELLDQTRLPDECVRLSVDTVDELVEAIQTLRVRGAPLLGVAGAMGLAACAKRARECGELTYDSATAWLSSVADSVRAARPTAVNLAWAVDRARAEALSAIERVSPGERPDVLVQALQRSAQAVWDDDASRCLAIGGHGAEVVPTPASVLTICNTGMLATGGIGTAFGVIRTAHERRQVQHVYACETRPLCQGARLTSWELARTGIPGTVLVDSAAATLLQSGRANFVIAGADRIAANGDAANKIGTLALATLAAVFDVPFYIAAPLSTVDPQCSSGGDIPIELRDATEITRVAAGIGSFNPAFDVTPAGLIHGIITEVGVLRQPYETSIRSAMDGSR